MDRDNDFINKEHEFLDKVSATYKMSESVYSRVKREFAIHTFLPFMQFDKDGSGKGTALQLGCADGFETKMLSGLVKKLDVLDGSEDFITECKKTNYPNVRFMHTLFEEYSIPQDDEKYDYVFASYVFEHVFDVQTVLDMIKSVLKPSGFVFVTVPNGRALSRQLALHMKIISGLWELTDNDKNHGHRRVYSRVTLNDDMENGGFEVVVQGGVLFKLLADFQMDKLLEDEFLTREHLEGLYKLGMEYPDMCDSLCSVCRMKR